MNRIATFLLFLFFIINTVNSTASRSQQDEMTGHIPSTREEVLARRERRKSEFGGRYEEYKAQLEDHESGRRRLNDVEVGRLERKLRAYERKLDQLHEEVDERHIDRLLQREEILNEMHRGRISRRSEL